MGRDAVGFNEAPAIPPGKTIKWLASNDPEDPLQ